MKKQYMYTNGVQLVNNVIGYTNGGNVITTLKSGKEVLIMLDDNVHLSIMDRDTGIYLTSVYLPQHKIETILNHEYRANK